MKQFPSKLLTIIICVIYVACPSPAWATLSEADYDFNAEIENLYYDNSVECLETGAILVWGVTPIEKIWNGLTSMGHFTPVQIAGILGNMYEETHYNPIAFNNDGAIGLVQWMVSNGGRGYDGRGGELKTALENASDGKFSPLIYQKHWRDEYSGQQLLDKEIVSDEDFNLLVSLNLEHIQFEMDGGNDWWDTRWVEFLEMTGDDVEYAARVFAAKIEGAAGGNIESPTLAARAKAAVDAWQAYERGDFNTPPPSGSSSSANCVDLSSFEGIVLAYAWPEYKGKGWIERMPAYAEAVETAISERRFVGGQVGGFYGIDCGGFVTIIVHDSGLDTNYNTKKQLVTGAETTLRTRTDEWEALNPSGTIDTSILQAGDVAFSGGHGSGTTGHTFIYVGDIDGFDSIIASASYSYGDESGGRAPMAGTEDLLKAGGAPVRWYRKKSWGNE